MLSLQGEVMRLIGGATIDNETRVQTVFGQFFTVRNDLKESFTEEAFVLQQSPDLYSFYFRLPDRVLCCIEVLIKDDHVFDQFECWKDYSPRFFIDLGIHSQLRISEFQKMAIQAVLDLPSYRLLAVTGEIKI